MLHNCLQASTFAKASDSCTQCIFLIIFPENENALIYYEVAWWLQNWKNYFRTEQKVGKNKFSCLKVSKSRKPYMVSSILPKIDRGDDFMHWKLSPRSFFGRIEDIVICFRDCLTFRMHEKQKKYLALGRDRTSNLQIQMPA